MRKIATMLFVCVFIPCFSQNSIDLKSTLKVEVKANRVKPDYSKYFRQADTEVELLYTGLFVSYKKFISSQDGSTCSFHPSCSEYAVNAMKKHGMVKGSMMFFDRYSRCNSLSPALYKIDFDKQKLIDEVSDF